MRLNLIEIIFTSVYISVSIKLACYNFTSLKIDMLMCSMDSSWRIQTMLQESGNPSSGNPRGWPYAFGQWYKSMIKGYRVYQVTNSSLFYYCPQKTKYSSATDAKIDKVRRVCFSSQGKCSLSRRLCWLCWKQRLRISASCVCVAIC